ncbi:hypothetical protein BU23DRAFT_548501 [Bimuria novae-zelandiae CBS 107.79]|uniref:Uncharacterized protein n=1 Tax=Bimuria novae-zelandiae CBS 107.79 TaxID=1447943 RepID=A0A6A5VSW0_9PLEO|nr:hypothetical protein BU23DRAFT_548501 [Bimuria novae-zelandiae CBS 107.79]
MFIGWFTLPSAMHRDHTRRFRSHVRPRLDLYKSRSADQDVLALPTRRKSRPTTPLEAESKSYLVELASQDDPANAKNWKFSVTVQYGSLGHPCGPCT